MSNGFSLVTTTVSLTVVVTFILSIYVFKTGRNFSRWRGFLFAGLIIVLLGSAGSILVPATQITVAGVSVRLFCGFILYDTGGLVNGEEDNYIMVAVNMYLNILNLFLDLPRLLKAFVVGD